MIADIASRVLNVSPKTNWFFVRVVDGDGRIGWGEASLNGWEPVLQACLELRRDELLGVAPAEALARLQVNEAVAGGLAANAITSALAQALCDLLAQAAGQPMWQWLAARHEWVERNPQPVRVYANINRATLDRSPRGVATRAAQARDAGFDAFKLAPFDGLAPGLCGTPGGDALIDTGLARLGALRDAAGPDAAVMADCHWRLSPRAALELLPRLDPLRLHWFECPIAETVEHWADSRAIRRAANDRGVLVAAAEIQVGTGAFQRIFDNGLVDVVMPDVKYCGGPLELLAIAHAARAAGVACSPHNPTGPVCTLHSLHLAAICRCPMLELQFDESPLTDALVCGQHPRVSQGRFPVPSTPGLGAPIDESLFVRHPYRRVPFGVV